MPTSIDDIIKKPFACRTHEEKLRIIREGKPRPILDTAVRVKSENGGEQAVTQQFDPTLYDNLQWLAGCDVRNTLFCWPCLLFKPALGLWNTTGVSVLTYLAEGAHKHEESVEHIHATVLLQKLLSSTSSTPVQLSDESLREFNEQVSRNHEILKRMTDAVCNLLMREQPFYKRPRGCQLDPENTVVKNLQFLRKYDVIKCNYIEDALDLIKISPRTIHDIMDTITKTLKLAVKKEIQGSSYVSLILNDHSKIAEKAQMSTILRYIKDGKVSERFVGFMNLVGPRSSSDVLQHISNVADEFGIAEQMVAVSLDGGVLSTAELLELNAKMKDSYPFTFFVPWYCHGVEYNLHQSLINVQDCSEFLKSMKEMKNFFSKKSRRFKSLESFMETNVPSTKNTRWFVRSQFITVVNSYRKYFILFFESILQSSTVWDADDVTKALGFQQTLEEFKTVFLLQVFSKLFEMVNPLYKILKSPTPENAFDKTIADNLISELFKQRDGGFKDVWIQVHNEKCIELPGPGPKRVKPDFDDPKIPGYRELYNSVFNSVIQEIEVRYCTLGKLNFCQLLTSDAFSNEKLQSLSEIHNGYFDKEQTRNELIVLRTNGKVFSNKSVYGLLDLFIKLKLQNGFKYLYKLIELIVTLPIKPPFEQGEVSKFDQIKKWSYIPDVVGVQTGDICVPIVEIDFLQTLKKSNSFHSDIAELFYEINKSMELIPK